MEKQCVQIIVPVYNSEKTIKKCLDSLKNQTYSYWQAIIVDDMSTDKSYEIVQAYAQSDERFSVVKQNENVGVARTRNKALSLVTAPYVAFLDSDDCWEENMLEVLINKSQEYDADVVQCRFVYDFENGKQVTPKGAFENEVCLEGKKLRKVYTKMMTGINMNHVCMKLIKTEMVKDLEFDSNLKTAEDLVFCIQMFKKVKKYVFVPDVLYHYFRSGVSLTGSSLTGTEKLRANRYASKVMAEALQCWGIDNPCYRMLTFSRPYVIILSKIYRTFREKILAGGNRNGR